MTLCLRSKRSTVQIGAGVPPLFSLVNHLQTFLPAKGSSELLPFGAFSENSDSELTSRGSHFASRGRSTTVSALPGRSPGSARTPLDSGPDAVRDVGRKADTGSIPVASTNLHGNPSAAERAA